MNDATVRGSEAALFGALNAAVEPLVRAGLFAPLPPWSPLGLIVLEHTGRHSGRLYRTPLLACALGAMLIVSTVRSDRSQWTQNLAATGTAHIWLNGQRLAVSAHVIHPAPAVGVTLVLLTIRSSNPAPAA